MNDRIAADAVADLRNARRDDPYSRSNSVPARSTITPSAAAVPGRSSIPVHVSVKAPPGMMLSSPLNGLLFQPTAEINIRPCTVVSELTAASVELRPIRSSSSPSTSAFSSLETPSVNRDRRSAIVSCPCRNGCEQGLTSLAPFQWRITGHNARPCASVSWRRRSGRSIVTSRC